MEGTFKDHLVQHPPCCGQGHLSLDQAAQSSIQPVLEHFRGGTPTTSLDNLSQCLTTLIIKHFLLMSNVNLLSFSLKPLPLVLSSRSFGCSVSLRALWSSVPWAVLQAACTWSPPLPVSPVILAVVDICNSKVCQIFCCPCRTTQQGRQRAHNCGYECCE